MKNNKTRLAAGFAGALVLFMAFPIAVHAQQADATLSYDQLVGTANSLLKQGKLDEAKQAAQQAMQQNANGYQAYAVAAKIASQQGAAADAANLIKKALELAPDDGTKAKVQQLAAMLTTTGSQSQPASGQSSLSSQDQRKLDVLMLILEDAEKAATPEDRAKAFREYLEKSGDFAAAHPEQTNVWVMRALAAVDVGEPKLGWDAGKQLQALGADNSENPKIRRIMASLDRKGWLGGQPPAPRQESTAATASATALSPAEGARLKDSFIAGVRQYGNFKQNWIMTVRSMRKSENGNIEGYEDSPASTETSVAIEGSNLKVTSRSRHWSSADTGAVPSYDDTEESSCLFKDLDPNTFHIEMEKEELIKDLSVKPAAWDLTVNCLTGASLVETKSKDGQGAEQKSQKAALLVKLSTEDGACQVEEALKRLIEAASQLGSAALGSSLKPPGQEKNDDQHETAEELNKRGVSYLIGKGVAKDRAKALECFRKAAEQGNSGGQRYLGDMYFRGWGVAKDLTEAAKWYRKAAEQGNASAQNGVGACCWNGWGVEKDYTEALKWYRKSAEQGNATGQSEVGWCYENGWGVDKDYTEALKWLRKAAEQGNTPAQNNIGWCYENGRGVKKDLTEAAKWYQKAADQGNAAAQNNIGLYYENGLGVEKNVTEAIKWYTKSAAGKNAKGEANLKRLTHSSNPTTTPIQSGQFIKVPSADELKKGAKVEIIRNPQ
jgi:TPR repeat protein